MARCNCSPASCACSISSGCGIDVSGLGTNVSPFTFALNIDAAGGLACGVDGLALTRVRTGTSAERTAATASDGDQWTETDTGIQYERFGGAWVQSGDLNGWTTYTPRIFVGTTASSELGVHGGSTLGNGTRYGRYLRIGRFIVGHASFAWGTTSSLGTLTGRITIEIPAAVQADMSLDLFPIGDGFVFDNGTANYTRNLGLSVVAGTPGAAFVDMSGNVVVQNSPIAVLASGDRFSINYHYEAGS